MIGKHFGLVLVNVWVLLSIIKIQINTSIIFQLKIKLLLVGIIVCLSPQLEGENKAFWTNGSYCKSPTLWSKLCLLWNVCLKTLTSAFHAVKIQFKLKNWFSYHLQWLLHTAKIFRTLFAVKSNLLLCLIWLLFWRTSVARKQTLNVHQKKLGVPHLFPLQYRLG